MSQNQKKREADRTLFIQNLSFSTTEDKLKDKFGQFGDLCYCKICIDKQTGLSKGSAFVCFRKYGICEKILENSYLFTTHNSRESDIEVDEHKWKEIKIKNVNYCINKYRICLRNLPKDVKEKDIRKELDKHCKHGKISDIKLTKGDKGKNKGYGFVQFTEHEDALNIVKNLNETIMFPHKKRIIVEFSIDDMVKLHKAKMNIQRKKFEKEKKEQFKANKVENKGKKDSTKPYKKSKHPKKLPQKVALAKRFNTKKSAF
ncbi:RNA-binding protein [Entamoeba marina]